MNDDITNIWKKKLTNKIIKLKQNGVESLEEFAIKCDGAQPKDINDILKSLDKGTIKKESHNDLYKNKFFFNLPAENPKNFQWWYTLNTQEDFSQQIIEETNPENIVCLGTPTIASTLSSLKQNVLLLDNDKEIVNLFNNVFADTNKSLHYDVHDDLDNDLMNRYDVIVIDPPWYENYFDFFFKRAIDLSKEDGIIYCSIPQVLTRPGIENERKNLINKMLNLEHELLYIEKNSFKYIVPKFEETVFKNSDFSISYQPWRSADLIAFKVKNKKSLNIQKFDNKKIVSFFRKGSETTFRIFLNEESIETGIFIKKIDNFSSSISQRDNIEEVNLWTSEKIGFQVENIKIVNRILTIWSEGFDQEETLNKLKDIFPNEKIENYINLLESAVNLWSRFAIGYSRRSNKEIKEINEKAYSAYAISPSEREHNTKNDGFRIEFQRDRDRIIWSTGFRKLADKTQLFPIEEDDNLRQRLSHSIEVMQLSSTIAASFGLNKDLVEAGALTHDIGHTPFGHAGEASLNNLFNKLNFTSGFNHYEHGVDVVRYLEGAYQKSIHNSHHGLDLTSEVCECILKHSYSLKKDKDLYRNSKHKKFISSKTLHLEGQCVRLADKISYLLSDLEDGIKLDAIKIHDLMSCRLFHRGPIDFRFNNEDCLHSKFIEQRGSIIKLLMEDIIIESSKHISALKSHEDVRNSDSYCIRQSKQLSFDLNEVWEKVQKAKLHNDPRVISANMIASKYVSELTLLFTLFPEYIEQSFKTNHILLENSDYLKFYRLQHSTVSIPEKMLSFLPLDLMIGFDINSINNMDIYHLICAKDYVANLSNKKVVTLYKKLLGN